MGVVWLAHDPRLDRHVAIGFGASHLGGVPEARARMREEARAASVLDHPGIATVHEIG
jgi:eukaryotic-like serine/threonine-protein kinase